MALAFGAPGKRAPFFFSSSFFPPGRLFAKREDNSSELALRSGLSALPLQSAIVVCTEVRW